MTELLTELVAFGVSLVCAIVGMPWLLWLCKKRGLYDIPNERKVHHNNIPRLGGIVFFPCMLLGMGASMMLHSFLYGGQEEIKVSTLVILAGIVLIYLIGLLDDVLGLNAKLKFTVQFVAALLMPLCNLYINDLNGLFGIYDMPMYVAWPVTVFVTLLIVNSINLIDGIDGLASSLSMVALLAFLVLFAGMHVYGYAMLILSLMAALLVFMYYNMMGSVERGTKTFMGDAGSLILGYTLAFLVIKYSMDNIQALPQRDHAFATAITFVVVPVFDLVRVAFTRLFQHKSIFDADKQHIHHLFMSAGVSMRRTLLCIVVLQLFYCVVNLSLCAVDTNINIILSVDIVIYALVILKVTHSKVSNN